NTAIVSHVRATGGARPVLLVDDISTDELQRIIAAAAKYVRPDIDTEALRQAINAVRMEHDVAIATRSLKSRKVGPRPLRRTAERLIRVYMDYFLPPYGKQTNSPMVQFIEACLVEYKAGSISRELRGWDGKLQPR